LAHAAYAIRSSILHKTQWRIPVQNFKRTRSLKFQNN